LKPEEKQKKAKEIEDHEIENLGEQEGEENRV
jgi:hypothetical protein